MSPLEVWLADMGMAAKTRPGVVLIADNLNAPRSLIIHPLVAIICPEVAI